MRKIDGVEYYTIEEASEFMGCSVGWVRRLISDKVLKSIRMGKRMLLVTRASAKSAAKSLTSRSKARRHLAVRPAAERRYVRNQPKTSSRG
jgi:excisionase family DNA binding protein